ncbi:MAG: hypothetical protein JKY52_04765 [Flavobacteriales bacterium]|nr:hypothetical protein [Flavobacteriales bacterium]
MDILFGTYVCPEQEPERFGIKEDFPKDYIGQLMHPLLPEQLTKQYKKRKEEST